MRAGLIGAVAAAAGLVLGTALKMIRNVKLSPLPLAVAAAAFGAIGLLAWPVVPVVLALVPLGVAAAAIDRRRQERAK